MRGNKFSAGALLLISVCAVFGQEDAPPCDVDKCVLPDCQCSGMEPNMELSEIPQLVFLSFDASVSVNNFAFYEEVFFNRKNPNGQAITLTFFASHEYSNYTMIHELYRRGHEIGLHSISANSSQLYWQTLNATGWSQEFVDQRDQLAYFANISANDVIGVRAQQLLVGGDAMYSALHDGGLKYDASRSTQALRTQGLWPYTNDYRSTQDCPVGTCPRESHPGFWTVPIVNWLSHPDEIACSLADQCVPIPETSDDTYALLLKNFENHYLNHRSPFGVYTRPSWVNGTDEEQGRQRRLGYIRFLDYLATLDDVYIVSIARGLEWVQDPTPLASVANFPSFQVTEKEAHCNVLATCRYGPEETPFISERYMYSCHLPCARYYPWVGNHLGEHPYN